MAKSKNDSFRFRRLDSIGAADAEEDKLYLQQCFVETGHDKILRDCSNPRRIILGRTGSGKTALLQRLAETEHRTIEIRPESLALSYISNSTILTFVSDLGVKLDIFFKLLWRHVFTVELLKRHFEIRTEEGKQSFLERIRNLFRDKKHQKALEYLETWGKSFWEETEYRIKELTSNLEENIRDSLGAKLAPLSFNTESIQRLSETQKQEVIQRAQHVVNQVQIRQLSDIIDLLDEVLNDPQKRYYLTIDRLDEDWIEDRLRYRLIRALIETVRDFRKVRHAKLIIAIRYDLLDRVIKLTRDEGFQEEKYESLFLPIDWTKDHLVTALDNRINFLVKQRYTKRKVAYSDLLPEKIGKERTIDYILDRTLMRPRDVIVFFNECISLATDKPNINRTMIREAEGQYSRNRLRALADEWHADYPNFIDFAMLLKGVKPHFKISALPISTCEDFCLDFTIRGVTEKDSLSTMAAQVADALLDVKDFRKHLFLVFHRIGLVGLKLDAFDKVIWITAGRASVSSAEVADNTRVYVHPAFWRVMGVSDR